MFLKVKTNIRTSKSSQNYGMMNQTINIKTLHILKQIKLNYIYQSSNSLCIKF